MSRSPLSYDAWRISYQSSEQAARAAYDMYLEAQTASQAKAPGGFNYERMLNAAANEITEIGRAAGVRPIDQLNGSLEILIAIKSIQARRASWRSRAEEAEAHLAIAKRANKNLCQKITRMMHYARKDQSQHREVLLTVEPPVVSPPSMRRLTSLRSVVDMAINHAADKGRG